MKTPDVRASRIHDDPIRVPKLDETSDLEVFVRVITVFLIFTAVALLMIGASE